MNVGLIAPVVVAALRLNGYKLLLAPTAKCAISALQRGDAAF